MQRDWDDAYLINATYDIHAEDLAFGYQFIAAESPNRGVIAGENRVARWRWWQRIWPMARRSEKSTPSLFVSVEYRPDDIQIP